MTDKQKRDLDNHCELIPRNGKTWANSNFFLCELDATSKQIAKWAINGTTYCFYIMRGEVFLKVNDKTYLVL